MPHRRLLRRITVPMVILALLTACNGQRGSSHLTPTPHSRATETSKPTPSTSPSSSPSRTSSDAMTLAAAQKKFESYYYEYIDSARTPAKGGPPARLIAQTPPGSPERNWLKNSYADGRKTGGYVASGNVRVSVGPETSANGNRTRIKFRACVDPGNLRVKVGSEVRKFPWQLMNVEMWAKKGSTEDERAKSPAAWLVYGKDTISSEKCGF